MNKTYEIINLVFLMILFMFLCIVAYDGFEQSTWRDRCKDAGGIPASHMVCVNPGAVIEVE